jgi:glyoxylase I family protein
MNRTLHFYCDLVGFKLIVRRKMDNGGEIAFIECDGGAQLEIVQPGADVKTPVTPLPRTEVGIKHFALFVDNIDKMYERLSAAGVEYTIPPRDAMNKDMIRRTSHSKDPDGVVVEFVERAAARAG